MADNPSITVVLPAFNEAENLVATVHAAQSVLRIRGTEYEILIIDDGSLDSTPDVCAGLAAEDSTVRSIRHPHNRGYGAALKTGFAGARCDLIFFTDSDGQFRFDELAEFSRRIVNCDMVIGYRADRQDPWHRKFNSRFGNLLARIFLGVRVRDINCAYKLFRRTHLQAMPLRAEGAMINTELLALARRAGWTFEEIPVRHYPRRFGTPTGANPGVILRTFQEYFALRRRIREIDPTPWLGTMAGKPA